MRTLGTPKPAPKAKKAKNPPIDKAEWLAYRLQRGWGFACDSGSGKPGHILHLCRKSFEIAKYGVVKCPNCKSKLEYIRKG